MIKPSPFCRRMTPSRLLVLLLLPLLLLSACSRSDGGVSGVPSAGITDEPARPDELYGSWMEISQNGMKIYTFRRNGSLSVYEMESVTTVNTVYSGRYTLSDTRLTIEIDGVTKVHSLLTGSGDALILDGQILTPTQEPIQKEAACDPSPCAGIL